MRFSRVLSICMFTDCQRLLGVSEPQPPNRTGISHGLCERCLQTHYGARENEREKS